MTRDWKSLAPNLNPPGRFSVVCHNFVQVFRGVWLINDIYLQGVLFGGSLGAQINEHMNSFGQSTFGCQNSNWWKGGSNLRNARQTTQRLFLKTVAHFWSLCLESTHQEPMMNVIFLLCIQIIYDIYYVYIYCVEPICALFASKRRSFPIKTVVIQ